MDIIGQASEDEDVSGFRPRNFGSSRERERKRRGTRIFSSSLHDGDMEVIPYICLRLRVLGVVLREDRTFHRNFTLFGRRNVTQVHSLCRCDLCGSDPTPEMFVHKETTFSSTSSTSSTSSSTSSTTFFTPLCFSAFVLIRVCVFTYFPLWRQISDCL